MATWVFALGGGIGDVTALVDVQSIVRNKRLFTEMKPNSNKLNFRMQFSASVWASLIASTSVSVAVTRDAVTYFTGIVSPNYETTITDGRKWIELIAEDFTLSKLGVQIGDITTYAGYAVCTPLATATSLVHAIATAAGVSLAAGLPTITSTVPYVCILPDDKSTWGDILGGILFEYGYCHSFLDDGTLTIFQTVNTGTITTTSTFLVNAATGNVRDQIKARKTPDKYDDIRVDFDTVTLKTGKVLFEDTSGATGTQNCNIALEATGNADGKDYYPIGARDAEIFLDWKSPDGTVWIATSAAMDATVGGSISMSRSLTNYYRRASFAYRNPSASVAYITKLRITGDAYFLEAKNTARSNTTGGSVLLEHKARYIFTSALAQALANRVNQYYQYSDFTYELKSHDNFDLGAYVLLSDPVYLGVSQKCRIVGKVNDESTASISYTLEAVADYAAITITVEGVKVGDLQGPQGLPGAQGAPGAAGGTTTWSGTSTEFPLNPSDNQASYIASLKKSYVFANNGVTPLLFNTTTLFDTTTLFEGGSWYQMTQDGFDGSDGTDGTDGSDGVPSIKSICFKRAAAQPSPPTGGSWASPTPSGWSDGIPADDGTPLWMSTRILTSDGNLPQQGSWTTPEKLGAPSQSAKFQWSVNGSSWHDTPAVDDIYMRSLVSTDNGFTWNVLGDAVQVKGEQGDPPDPATLPRYLGALSALPGSANWGDTCLFYTSLTTRGLYSYDAGWTKETAPSTELISASWPDICKAILSQAAGGFVGGPYGTAPDYLGSGVNFMEVLAVQTAFINKLFAQYVKVQTGGSIRAGDRYAEDGTDSGSGDGAWMGANGILKARSAILDQGILDELQGGSGNLGAFSFAPKALGATPVSFPSGSTGIVTWWKNNVSSVVGEVYTAIGTVTDSTTITARRGSLISSTTLRIYCDYDGVTNSTQSFTDSASSVDLFLASICGQPEIHGDLIPGDFGPTNLGSSSRKFGRLRLNGPVAALAGSVSSVTPANISSYSGSSYPTILLCTCSDTAGHFQVAIATYLGTTTVSNLANSGSTYFSSDGANSILLKSHSAGVVMTYHLMTLMSGDYDL